MSGFSPAEILREAEAGGAEPLVFGKSVEGRELVAFKKGEGEVKMLLVGRLHGNEPAPSLALVEFLKRCQPEKVSVYVVPLANPDGAWLYFHLWQERPWPHWLNSFAEARTNRAGVDLNRDWLRLSQPETKALAALFLRIMPHVVLDHHEFYWKDGFPPSIPLQDGGFLATLTDAPYPTVDPGIKELSRQLMEVASEKASASTGWYIKLRHFLASRDRGAIADPSFFGVYAALNGAVKLLAESWGVGCSTLMLRERIAFHLAVAEAALEWAEERADELKSRGRGELELDGEGDGLKELLSRHGFPIKQEGRGWKVRIERRRLPFFKALEKGGLHEERPGV